MSPWMMSKAWKLHFPNKMFSERGGHFMSKNAAPLTFTFENPNTPKAFEHMLKKVLIERLLSRQNMTAPVKNSPTGVPAKIPH